MQKQQQKVVTNTAKIFSVKGKTNYLSSQGPSVNLKRYDGHKKWRSLLDCLESNGNASDIIVIISRIMKVCKEERSKSVFSKPLSISLLYQDVVLFWFLEKFKQINVAELEEKASEYLKWAVSSDGLDFLNYLSPLLKGKYKPTQFHYTDGSITTAIRNENLTKLKLLIPLVIYNYRVATVLQIQVSPKKMLQRFRSHRE